MILNCKCQVFCFGGFYVLLYFVKMQKLYIFRMFLWVNLMYCKKNFFNEKKNEIMSSAATWMNLEMIILSEVSLTEKNKHQMLSLIGGVCVYIYILIYIK